MSNGPELCLVAKTAIDVLAANPAVVDALRYVFEQDEATIAEQIALTEIPAPPFGEEVKAAEVKRLMELYGLQDVHGDEEGNVVGRIPGSDPNGPVLAIGAHMDTVFPAGTDVKVRREGGRLLAPGISDDNRGLAAILCVARALLRMPVKPVGDVLLLATVGEEGNGDLRGSKHFFLKSGVHVDGFISLDSTNVQRILRGSPGSRRFRVTFSCTGGHSWHKFGNPSANHALCRAVALVGDVQVPSDPRTSFTVGVISGGTTINAVAAKAQLELDVRSVDNDALNNAVDTILPLFAEGARRESERWGTGEEVKVDIQAIGNRPAGSQPDSSPVLQAAFAAQTKLGLGPVRWAMASTDQNIPLSIGIPATTLGAGGAEGNNHVLTEWYDPTDAYQGPQLALLTVLGLVGLTGVTKPLLPVRK